MLISPKPPEHATVAAASQREFHLVARLQREPGAREQPPAAAEIACTAGRTPDCARCIGRNKERPGNASRRSDLALLTSERAIDAVIEMRRRNLLALIAGAAALRPRAGVANTPDRVQRVGMLIGYADNDPETQARLAAFRHGLETLGWTEGGNIRIDYRFAPANPDQAQMFARELVALRPDALVGNSTPATAALLRETRTIPIIFVGVSDPVGSGFVASIARPGANATGFTNFEPSLTGKWLEMLKEIAPGVTRVAVIFNPNTAPDGGSFFLGPFASLARSFAVEPIAAPVSDDAEIETAFASIGREPGGGMIVMPDAFTTVHRKMIIEQAALRRLPVVYPYHYQVVEGGLMAYGVDTVDLLRRAAPYVDRILKGEKPADLPVQAPTKFELVINLKTAKGLGLTVPPALLARAGELIE
jgi:putative ABC transport system substrate-binding protein